MLEEILLEFLSFFDQEVDLGVEGQGEVVEQVGDQVQGLGGVGLEEIYEEVLGVFLDCLAKMREKLGVVLEQGQVIHIRVFRFLGFFVFLLLLIGYSEVLEESLRVFFLILFVFFLFLFLFLLFFFFFLLKQVFLVLFVGFDVVGYSGPEGLFYGLRFDFCCCGLENR